MTHRQSQRDGVPEDYPGRIVRFPDGISEVVIMVFGVQGADDDAHKDFIAVLTQFGALSDGPARLERGETSDAGVVPTSLLLVYWAAVEDARRWWHGDARTIGSTPPVRGACGYFRECMTIPQARFNYAAGTEDRHGQPPYCRWNPAPRSVIGAPTAIACRPLGMTILKVRS